MKDYAVERRQRGEVYEFTDSEMASSRFRPTFVRQHCAGRRLRADVGREFALTCRRRTPPRPGSTGLVFADNRTREHLSACSASGIRLARAVVHSGEDLTDARTTAAARLPRRQVRSPHPGEEGQRRIRCSDRERVAKLDAVSARTVIQSSGAATLQHELPAAQNLLHVFIGRDPRLGSIIEHLEREAPPLALKPNAESLLLDDQVDREDEAEVLDEEEREGVEILEVTEAGDSYLDETGRFVDGQQMTMFGVAAPAPKPDVTAAPVVVEVVDIHGELQDAIEYCKTWTNRAAKERRRRMPASENHHAALNLAYSRESGRKGTLSTSAEYRAKGDWMKRKYLELMR